jgi:hypothetical protein
MEFGNDFKVLRKAIIAGAVFGLVAMIFAICVSATGHWAPQGPIALLFVFLGPPVAIGLGAAPTLACSVRIRGKMVQQVLFKKYVVSQYPVADFVRTGTGGCGQFLLFREKRKMRLVGMHLAEFARLGAVLHSLQEKSGAIDA